MSIMFKCHVSYTNATSVTLKCHVSYIEVPRQLQQILVHLGFLYSLGEYSRIPKILILMFHSLVQD